MRLRQKPTMKTQSTSTKSGTMPAAGGAAGSWWSSLHGMSIMKPQLPPYLLDAWARIVEGRKSSRPKATKERAPGRLARVPGPLTASSPRLPASPSKRSSTAFR